MRDRVAPGEFGITVDAIAPVMIDTDATLARVPARAPQAAAERIALRRVGHPGDPAPLLSFLCSDEAGYITGQTIVVDGGGTMFG